MNKEGMKARYLRTEKRQCLKHGDYEVEVNYLPMFNVETSSACPKCIEEFEARDNANEALEKLKAIGIPQVLLNESVDTFKLRDEACRAAVNKVKRYIGSTTRGRNLIISGDTGTGKSHLACAVIREIHDGGRKYRHVNQILDEIKATYSRTRGYTEERKDSIMKRYTEVDYLIIDDFDEFNATADNKKIMGDLLSARHNNQVQTILVAMLRDNRKTGVSEIRDKLGSKLYRRLYERGAAITLGSWYQEQLTLNI